jgi:hypothetical protein
MSTRDLPDATDTLLQFNGLKKALAERYLFENSADLSSVCSLAGIDVGQLRTSLNKVRDRTLLDLLPITA